MIDVIEKIVSLLLSARDSLKNHRDTKLKSDFGRGLLSCYFRLLEVIETAHWIVWELEGFVERYEIHIADQDNWRYWGGDLQMRLKRQALNLERLGHAVGKIRRLLLVLVPECEELLTKLVFYKGNVLVHLSYILRMENLPLQVDLSRMSQVGYGGMWTPPKLERIDASPVWEDAAYHRVREYLATDKPQDKLVELKKAAEMIRTFLIESFSLDEILWNMESFGDPVMPPRFHDWENDHLIGDFGLTFD